MAFLKKVLYPLIMIKTALFILLISSTQISQANKKTNSWIKNGFKEVESIKINFPPNHRPSRPLNIVLLRSANWSVQDIYQHAVKVNEVYSQCNVRFSPINITTVTPPKRFNSLDKFNDDEKNSITNLRSLIPISRNELTVFLVKEFDGAPELSGFSRANWTNGDDLKPILFNTTWMTNYSRSSAYRQDNPGRYDLLSHEILHILTLKGQHISPVFKSLLSTSRARTNKILEENCRLIRKSFLINDHQDLNSNLH